MAPKKSKGTFLRLVTSAEHKELWQDPDAFLLANVIAWRQRDALWNGGNVAYLGDHREYGMTRTRYRRARRKLEAMGVARFETKQGVGTVASLVDTTYYDLSTVAGNPFRHLSDHVARPILDPLATISSDSEAKTYDKNGPICDHISPVCSPLSATNKERHKKDTTSSGGNRVKKKKEDVREVFERLMGEERFAVLTVPEFREVFLCWLDHRERMYWDDKKNGMPSPESLKRDLAHCAKVGVKVAVWELGMSIRREWTGFYGWRGYKSPSEEEVSGGQMKNSGGASRIEDGF